MNKNDRKSILVVDEPRVCSECDLFKNYYDEEHEEWDYCCAYTEQIIDIDEAEQHRHKDCPLKSMPKKKGISLKEAIGEKCSCYSDGWNDCIEAILGKEKE